MNYCSCSKPKSLKNEAHGQAFFVCAKSSGGCGKEIMSQYSEQPIVITHIPKQIIIKLAKAIDPTMFIGSVSFERSKTVVCSECNGGGMIAKLYPNGHTEITCDYCGGTGEVEEI